MKKTNFIKSVDGKNKITVEEFDALFDSGSDEIDQYIAWDKGFRPGHGGARAGAGRKVSGRKPYFTHLHPSLIKKIKQRARKQHSPECEIIELALKKAFA